MPLMNRTILITGASTGIGAATALRLAQHGATVYAGVRREEDGAALAAQHRSIRPLALDVTDAAQIEAARRRIESEADGRLDGLVNNAGIAVAAPLEVVPIEALRSQFEVNVFGLVAVTQACLPFLRAARGRIVNVSSIGGRSASPFIGPYAASKFAVEALTDALRMELRPSGIRVVAVEPGSVKTEIWDRGAQTAREFVERYSEEERALYGKPMAALARFSATTAQRGSPPERIAAIIERALTVSNPRHRYLIGADARAQLVLNYLPSAWRDALMVRAMGVGS